MEQEFEVLQTKTGQVVVKKMRQRILDYSKYFLSYEEAKKMKDTALSFGQKANIYYCLISLMLNCGLRRSEARKLKIEQINMTNMRVELGVDTKTRTPRQIPFSENLKMQLLAVIANRTSGFVFMHDSKGRSKKSYSDAQINNIVATVGAKAGIMPKSDGLKNVNPHLLRHSWVKFCQKAGIDKNNVRVMGGWKTMKMIDLIYGVPDYETISNEYNAKMNW